MTTLIRTSIITLITATLSFAGIIPPREGDLTANIPFQFVLQGKTLPAGYYIIRAEKDGQVQICEDGVYCESVKTYTKSGENGAGRIEFRHDGTAFHLSLLADPTGTRHQVPIDEPLILPSGDGDESVTSVEVRPLYMHSHTGMGLAPAWH
jgi:hypothetical protein